MILPVVAALQGSEDWDVFTGPSGALPHPSRAIKLTAAAESGSTALTVVKSDNTQASTGELAVGALEPHVGVKEITGLGAGVAEYKVYY